MSRRPFSDPLSAAQFASRNRRPRREATSKRLINRLLSAWLLLIGAVLLTQAFPFPGSTHIGYWLMVGIVLGIPLLALLTLWLMSIELREAFHRLRVLRRAAKWKRKEPSTSWLEEDGSRHELRRK
jgi:hypothetical protein